MSGMQTLKTMRIWSGLMGHQVAVLVDSRSTHFISARAVQRVNLQPDVNGKLEVLVALDLTFATDQTECHLEVESTGYESYDSLAKRHLLVSFGLFLRIYYKRGMLGEQSASLSSASILTKGQSMG
ncbi:hypothetical protein Fot_35462 [Forsythia ovata]|uniref:Uncharacterized protein n=1 Tax=Forsythia ovata TaxID=205694 RepID=A0ABD1SN05_9LAMI